MGNDLFIYEGDGCFYYRKSKYSKISYIDCYGVLTSFSPNDSYYIW